MRKITFILLIFLCSLFPSVYGQTSLGFRGSFNISSLSTGQADSRPGFSVGTILSTPISEKWYFQPSLMFSLSGSKASDSYNPDYSAYVYSLDLPLVFSYRIGLEDLNLGFDMGAFGRYGLFGGYWVNDPDGNGRLKPDIFDDHKRFDFGPQIGFSVIACGIYMGFAYQHGLIKPWDFRRGRYYNYGISFGYMFQL